MGIAPRTVKVNACSLRVALDGCVRDAEREPRRAVSCFGKMGRLR